METLHREWIRAGEATKLLGITNPRTFVNVIRAAKIRARLLPGTSESIYCRSDVIEVADQSTYLTCERASA